LSINEIVNYARVDALSRERSGKKWNLSTLPFRFLLLLGATLPEDGEEKVEIRPI